MLRDFLLKQINNFQRVYIPNKTIVPQMTVMKKNVELMKFSSYLMKHKMMIRKYLRNMKLIMKKIAQT